MFQRLVRIKYLAWNVLVSLDQLGNAMTGGDPDETISSRAGKAAIAGEKWALRIMCPFLDWIDPGHCTKSIEPDEGKNAVFPNPSEK